MKNVLILLLGILFAFDGFGQEPVLKFDNGLGHVGIFKVKKKSGGTRNINHPCVEVDYNDGVYSGVIYFYLHTDIDLYPTSTLAVRINDLSNENSEIIAIDHMERKLAEGFMEGDYYEYSFPFETSGDCEDGVIRLEVSLGYIYLINSDGTVVIYDDPDYINTIDDISTLREYVQPGVFHDDHVDPTHIVKICCESDGIRNDEVETRFDGEDLHIGITEDKNFFYYTFSGDENDIEVNIFNHNGSKKAFEMSIFENYLQIDKSSLASGVLIIAIMDGGTLISRKIYIP